MNENLAKFSEAAAKEPALQAKILAVHGEAAREVAEKIAALAAESGTPFTTEEFLAASRPATADLSEEDLAQVAGGAWTASSPTILTSIFTLGIGCGIAAAASAIGGNVDSCQPTTIHDRLPN